LIAGIVGVDPAEGMDIPVSCVVCFRDFCEGLITHSEQSYKVCVFLIVCGPEDSKRGSQGPILVFFFFGGGGGGGKNPVKNRQKLFKTQNKKVVFYKNVL
jgi:hypothetical protein